MLSPILAEDAGLVSEYLHCFISKIFAKVAFILIFVLPQRGLLYEIVGLAYKVMENYPAAQTYRVARALPCCERR